MLSGMCCPSDGMLTAMLRSSWKASLVKKYHTLDMDFSRVQRSGVSKILLKGESYTAPPNIKAIEMEERWRWRPGNGVKYLDASCLLFNNKGNFVEAVDFSKRSSQQMDAGGLSAVMHSGDILDYNENSGLHTISINLSKLLASGEVSSMYITMSSYAGAKLSDIEQPFVEIVDPATGMNLCVYHLGDVPRQARQCHTAVIMCRVFREVAMAPGSSVQWKVQAVGHLSMGSADDYMPILETIASLS